MATGLLAASFFDSLHPRASDDEVAWYARHIGDPSMLALDAMCGAGRVLIPLLARGLKVHGVDASPPMIARCEEKLAAQSLATTVLRQDVVSLNVPFRYGAAFIAGSAFDAIVDPADASAALARIRAHLVGPATLVVACHVPSMSLQRLAAPLIEVRTVKLDDGSQIAQRSETTWTEGARSMRAQRRYSPPISAVTFSRSPSKCSSEISALTSPHQIRSSEPASRTTNLSFGERPVCLPVSTARGPPSAILPSPRSSAAL